MTNPRKAKPKLRKGEQVWWTIANLVGEPIFFYVRKTKKQTVDDAKLMLKLHPEYKPVKIIVRIA
jgi:hypothetical protein